MAKFFYRMQNVLDIKYKLEETAKMEYAEARRRLNEAEDRLQNLYNRKKEYCEEYSLAIQGDLDFLKIEERANAIAVMDEMIESQNEVIKKLSKELEQARVRLSEVMQERKMHEKLKEKRFEEFITELNSEEKKENDELVSYKFNSTEKDVEE